MIKVHNRKFVGMAYCHSYDIVITPATKTEGMWWWKKSTMGWALVQAVFVMNDIDVDKLWRVIFWTDNEDTAREFHNKMDLLNVPKQEDLK